MKEHATTHYAGSHNKDMQPTAEDMDQLREFARRLRDERFEGNDSSLARAMGVHQSTVHRFLSGSAPRMPVLIKLAKVAGLTLPQLFAWTPAQGVNQPPAEPADSPPPSPVSEVRETEVSNDVIDELLAQAWDPEEHGPADARVVGEALRSQAALLRGHVDRVEVVRALLDTSADARSKGKVLTAEELPMVALGTTKRKLTAAEAKIAYYMSQATLEAEAMGLPIPDGPHPAFLAAQKAAFGEDFVEEPEEDEAPPPKKKGGRGGQ